MTGGDVMGGFWAGGGSVPKWNLVEDFATGPNVGYEGAAGGLPGTATMTVACVCYGRNVQAGAANAFIAGNQNAAFQGWGFELNATIMRFQTTSDTAAAPTFPDLPPRNVAWMLLHGVRDVANNRIRLYINGSLAVNVGGLGAWTPSAAAPSVGYHAAASARPFVGAVSALGYLENVALTDHQIADHLLACIDQGDFVDDGLGWTHYWTQASLAGAPATWTSAGSVGGLVLTRQGAPGSHQYPPKWY